MKIILASFALVFLAELGDKTQLTALAFTSSSRSPWLVFIGSSLALITASGLAIAFGEVLGRILPQKVLHISSGVLFVIMGLILLVNVARKAEIPGPGAVEEPVLPEGRSAIFSLVTSQASAFENGVIEFLEEVVRQLPDGVQKDMVRQIISEDRQHAASLARLQDTQGTAVAALAEPMAAAQLAELKRCLPDDSPLKADDQVRTPEQAIQVALEAEEALAEFYLSLARMSKIHVIRDAFRFLAMEDIRHAQNLCSLINADDENA